MAVNTALIGFGLAGASFHAPLMLAESRLRLVRVVTSRDELVAAAHPDAIVTSSPEAAIADPAIDLVVIATTNETHAPIARAALLAGKHVVIDKPFVAETAEGAALIKLAREKSRMLTVFHNRRWDGDFLTVAGMMTTRRLGDVMLAELRWDRFRTAIKQGWREVPGEGSGALADLGPHLIDQALRLFGPPDAIEGDVAAQREEALVDDYFELTLHYGNRRVILSSSTLTPSPRPRFALHGTAASYIKYGIDPQEAVLRSGGSPSQPGYGEEQADAYGWLVHPDGSNERVRTERGNWRVFYRQVADAVLEGSPPPVNPVDALTGLTIIDTARRSARDGRLLKFMPPEI